MFSPRLRRSPAAWDHADRANGSPGVKSRGCRCELATRDATTHIAEVKIGTLIGIGVIIGAVTRFAGGQTAAPGRGVGRIR